MAQWWDSLVTNLGTQNAPFGFGPPMGPGQGSMNPAYDAGMNMIGDMGMRILATGGRNPLQALGRAYIGASENAQSQNKQAFAAKEMMDAAEEKRKERERQAKLDSKWGEWASANTDKFGPYADLAPYLSPEQGMQVLSGMEPELTSDQREYKGAVAQGYTGTFLEYQKELKKAGASTTTIDMKGEGAFEKKAGEKQAERFDTIISEGDTASAMMGDVQSLREIGAAFESGKSAEIMAAIGPWAESLGVPIEGLGPMQAYDAIVSRMAPKMRTPGAGASSDFDARQFLKSLPALGKSEAGNAIIENTLEAISQHKLAAADIASKAIRGEIPRDEAERQIRALPDPWALWKKAKASYPAIVGGGSARSTSNPAEMSDEEILKRLQGN